MAKIFLDHGMDPNKTYNGKTALDMARYDPVRKVLREHGGKPCSKSEASP